MRPRRWDAVLIAFYVVLIALGVFSAICIAAMAVA